MVLLLLACGLLPRETDLSARLTASWCGFWGCTGVDPATEWCHEDYDQRTLLHQQQLIDLGYVLDEDAVDACVVDMGGGPEGDPYCACGGCTTEACCACGSNPIKALNHLYGVPEGTRFDAGG